MVAHKKLGAGKMGRREELHQDRSFPGGEVVKNQPANAGDTRDPGLIPESGIFSAEGHGNPLQYSCLENPMDKGAWQATVYRVTRS